MVTEYKYNTASGAIAAKRQADRLTVEGLSPGPVELCSPPVSPSLPTAEGERVATPVGVILPWIYQHGEWDLWLGKPNRTNVQTVPVLYVYLIQNCLTYCNVRTSTLTIEYAELLCFL